MKKTGRVILLLIITAGLLLSLASCQRLIYYLEQVQKVYGKVTVAGSGGETPICSVEVFVGDYQYSELTNYCGDYELEMVEGTWTINFSKEGYEPYSTEVTLGAEEPRVRLDVELVWIEPPEPINLEGYWDFFYYPEGEDPEEGGGEEPSLWYIAQTGTELYCTPGEPPMAFAGTIDGPAVTMTGELGTINATVSYDPEDNQIIAGQFISAGEYPSGEVLFSRSEFEFGSIYLNGTCAGVPIELDTDYGHAYRNTEHSESVRFSVLVGSVSPFTAELDFSAEALYEDTFTVRSWDDEDGDGEGGDGEEESPELHATLRTMWMPYDEHEAIGGTVVIGVYSGTHMEGTFDLDFQDGSHLSGWFNVNFDSSGQSYVQGDWQGDSFVPAGPASAWSSFFAGDWTGLRLKHWDDKLNVDVWFTFPGAGVSTGTYTMSPTGDEFWGHLEWSPAEGPQLEDVEFRQPSTFTLEICDEIGHRVKGSFQLSFNDGGPATLIGEFDVPFTDGEF